MSGIFRIALVLGTAFISQGCSEQERFLESTATVDEVSLAEQEQAAAEAAERQQHELSSTKPAKR